MNSWVDELSGATPTKAHIRALSVTRNFKGVDTKFDSIEVGKSVLIKGGAAEIELALSPMIADEEWIELEFPEFSISIERPKSKPLLQWLSPKMKKAVADAKSKSKEPSADSRRQAFQKTLLLAILEERGVTCPQPPMSTSAPSSTRKAPAWPCSSRTCARPRLPPLARFPFPIPTSPNPRTRTPAAPR